MFYSLSKISFHMLVKIFGCVLKIVKTNIQKINKKLKFKNKDKNGNM